MNNNNDLDSLLNEFQSLSKNETDNNNIIQPVQAVTPQPVMPEVVQAVAPQPVMPESVQAVAPQPVMPEPVQNKDIDLTNSLTKEAVTNIEVQKEVQPEISVGNDSNNLGDGNNDESGNNKKKSSSGMIFMILLFILFGVAIFMMPKIINYNGELPGKVDPNQTVQEEETEAEDTKENVKDEEDNNEEITGEITTLTCTAPTVQPTAESPSMINISRIFTFEDDKLISDKEVNVTTYTKETFINELKTTAETNCSAFGKQYATVAGYNSECAINDNVLTSTTAIDYKVFVNPTEITLDGNTTTLTSIVKLNDTTETVKLALEKDGVICK